MSKLFQYLQLWLLPAIIGCATSAPVANTTKVTDDLSQYRTIYTDTTVVLKAQQQQPGSSKQFIAPLAHQNNQTDHWLAQQSASNKNITTAQGYRVVVYSGSSREDAVKIYTEVISGNTYRAKLDYEQPYFKVKVGNFFTKLEAHQAFVSLKITYPEALIIAGEVEIFREDYIKQ